MNIDEVVAQYSKQLPMYERFTRKLKDLLEILLEANAIEYDDIRCRTKTVESLRDKIEDRSYADPLNEITDLSGVRIIVHRLSDVPKVRRLIKGDFDVDRKNSKDKIEDLRVEQFGYRSVHLIVRMRKNRTGLKEWEPYREIKAEIQVRTSLQDVWAVLSHPYDYKVAAVIPRDLRRRLFRLSAVFDSADEEIDNLTKSLKAEIKNSDEKVKRGEVMPFNIVSLAAFINGNREAKYWIRTVRRITRRPIDELGKLSRTVQVAEFCKLKNTGHVESVLRDAHGWGEKFISNYFAELVKRYETKVSSTNPTKDGIISGLIIASQAEQLTDEMLEGEFGFPSSPILSAALKARV